MDDRTEPNNCTGTNWYGGTRFWYDIIWFGSRFEVIWFGSWFVILVRNFGTKVTPGCKSFDWFHNGSHSKCYLFSSDRVPVVSTWSQIEITPLTLTLSKMIRFFVKKHDVIMNSIKVSDCESKMLTNQGKYGNGLIEFEQKIFR